MTDLVYQNTAESGLTDGTAVTILNSDDGSAGTAFASVQGTWTFATAAAKSGSLGYQLTVDGTARYLRGDDTTVSAGERGGAGGWFEYPGTPGASYSVYVARSAADVVMGSINLFTDGKPYVYSRTGSRVTTGYTVAPVALTGSGWYRFSYMITPGGSTTTASLEAKMWDASGTLVMHYALAGTYDAGTTDPVGRNRFGGMTNVSTGLTVFKFDNLRWGHVASGDIGDVANAAPTATITANQNLANGIACSATVVPSDSDGTIASQVWSIVSGSSTSTLGTLTNTTTTTVNGSATPALGNLVTLQCLVTDNGGATVTPTTEIRTPLAGATTAVPLALNGTNVVGTMTNTGGASTDGAALADASDSTYIESGTVSGTEQSERYRWQPSNSRSAAAIPIRLGTDTGTAHAVVRLYEGTTLRETFASTAITSTPTDYTFTLAGATVSAISDWGNLYFEVGFTS